MKYFKMSRHFNKNIPEEYGLVKEENKIISPIDHSIWEPKKLYDFGWGKENGYYKIPLPNFEGLIKIILEENNEDDIYGAAAIILESYPKELLLFLKSLATPSQYIKEKLNMVFHLQTPINRSFQKQMSLEEIFEEQKEWVDISKKFQ